MDLHILISSTRLFYKNFRNKDNGMYVIDLHGLLAYEAIQVVSQRMTLLSKEESLCHLDIITGMGKHQTGNPILRPTILEYLEKNHITFNEPLPGRFVVTLRKKC